MTPPGNKLLRHVVIWVIFIRVYLSIIKGVKYKFEAVISKFVRLSI